VPVPADGIDILTLSEPSAVGAAKPMRLPSGDQSGDHRHVDTVDDEREPHRYQITLDQLERTVRVPVEDHVIEQPADPIAAGESDWDYERRQLRLAGGA
jgi:hypothetical protein